MDRINDTTTLTKTPDGTVLLSNTLISREFLLDPDFATIDFRDLHATNSTLLRYVKPDGIRYNIGGVKPNTQCAYFNRTDFGRNKALDTQAFHLATHEVGIRVAPFSYSSKRGAPSDIQQNRSSITLIAILKFQWND